MAYFFYIYYRNISISLIKVAGFLDQQDYRNNEFYSFRYSSRFQKGEIVDVRLGNDLEAARFQARKNFPDVLNEYWWLKPSDIPMMKEIPLQISDIFYYTGGIPVIVLVAANGSLFRKAQIFMKKKDEPKSDSDNQLISKIELLEPNELCQLLLSANLHTRRIASKTIVNKFPDFQFSNDEAMVIHQILCDKYEAIAQLGKKAVDHLVERFFITSRPKEHESILQTLIQIGPDALPKLEDTVEYISEMASPFYAKRLKWTIAEIKKGK